MLFNLFQLPTGLETGIIAPNFRLYDYNDKLIALQDYSGQSILLIFSSTSCPSCQEIYPILKRFNEIHPDINMLMISRGTKDDNQKLAIEDGLTFPILTWQEEVVKNYQVPSTPWFYLINSQGVITNQGTANTLEQLERLAMTEN